MSSQAVKPSQPKQTSAVEKLARLLRGENRQNLIPEEALAMGDTLLNRTELHGWPSTLEEVLEQKNAKGQYQYSPMNPANPNYPVIQAFGPDHPEWSTYLGYAQQVMDAARTRSPYTHYWAGLPPSWAKGLTDQKKIGSHTFGVEKRKKKKGAK